MEQHARAFENGSNYYKQLRPNIKYIRTRATTNSKQQPISRTFAYHVRLMCVHGEPRTRHDDASHAQMRYINSIIIISSSSIIMACH